MKYIILADRPCHETLYYVESLNGGKMVPLAKSLAYEFDNCWDAVAKRDKLKNEYKGLLDWIIATV